MFLVSIVLAILVGGFLGGAAATDLDDPNAPLMAVGYLASPPVLDGRIEAEEWAAAGGTDGFHRLDTEEFLADAPKVLIGFDDRALYLGLTVPLPEGTPPRTGTHSRDGSVWSDDAIEIFLDPNHDHRTSYQFVVNAAGVQADLLNQDLSWNGEWSARTSVAPGAWSLEVAIPWATLGLEGPPESEGIGFNLGWDCQSPQPVIGSWAPLTGSFHQPARFGHLLLRRQGPAVRLRRLARPGRLAFEALAAILHPVPSLEATLSVRRGEALIGESAEALLAGKPVTLAVALPLREGRPEEGDYRCEMAARIRGETRPVARLAGLVHVRPPLQVTLRPYFIAGKLLVEADAAGLEGEAAALEATLQDSDGRELARQRRQAGAGPSTFEFHIASYPAGPYAVEVAAADAADARLAAATVSLVKPETPAWLHSQAGFSDQVLPPWTPIKVERKGKEGEGRGKLPPRLSPGLTLKTSGRAYRFEGLPFPAQITTRGASILARPLALRAWVEGREVQWQGQLQVEKEAPAQVVLSGRARGGGLRLDSTLTLDFDGNARVDVRLSADRPVRLEKLVLEAPLKRAHARYLYHFPGSWGSSRNARALPEEGWASAFVPYVWLGDEDRGFALYTESDEYWRPADPDRAVEVATSPRGVTLRLNLIGRPAEVREKGERRMENGDAGASPFLPGASPLSYTFGFVATPVKTPEKDVWDYRICHYGNYGLEKQTVHPSSFLRYPALGNLNLAAGTLEMWVRVRFDPQAPVTNYASRGSLNRDLLKIISGDQTLGFYWNIDDRGMRVYLQQGTSYPFVSGAPSEWREGEWHHLALSWGEELRAYVDGQLTVRCPWQGLVAAPLEQTTIEFGGTAPGFDVDEIRISNVQREPQAMDSPLAADEHTLLLDPLDRLEKAGRFLKTVPERGTPGEVSGRVELVAGRSGQALALASGEPMLLLDYLKQLGVRTIVFHEHWTEYQNYPETFLHQEELQSLVQACHERGLQLLLYFGNLMADTCPEWADYHHEMLVMPQQGEYRREPEQRAYAVCYRSAWQDFLADGIAKLLDKYDIDGVYLDGTEYPWACQNVHHGCGYVRPDGTIAPTYGIFAARQMVRRIYTLVRNHRPDGQVNMHNSTVMTIPTLGWATSSWDGEQFGSIPRGVDVRELLPLDAFRCEFMGRQWGVPAEFLCYERPYTSHEALSFTLLHDVLVRGSGPSLEEEAALWKAMEAFGRKQARFLPYWNNAAYVRVAPEQCYATLYSRGKQGVMCVVSNLGPQEASVQVRLNLKRLRLPARVQAVDALTGDPVPIQQGSFVVTLRSFDYMLVQVTPRP